MFPLLAAPLNYAPSWTFSNLDETFLMSGHAKRNNVYTIWNVVHIFVINSMIIGQ
jgi:hypothetical protein